MMCREGGLTTEGDIGGEEKVVSDQCQLRDVSPRMHEPDSEIIHRRLRLRHFHSSSGVETAVQGIFVA